MAAIDSQIVMTPDATDPSAEVTIVLYNGHDAAAMTRCLQSIRVHPPLASTEIVFASYADAASDAAELVSEPMRIAHGADLLGACNAAIAMARGEFVYLLSGDCTVSAGWLDALLAVMRDVPDCGVVGSKLVFSDTRIRQAGGIVWNDGTCTSHGRGERDGPAYAYLHETDYCSGASLLLRREALVAAGCFDENLASVDFADVDTSFALRARGWKTYYCPRSTVTLDCDGADDMASNDTPTRVVAERAFRERWRPQLRQRHAAPGERLFRARERGMQKRYALVIDHYVPQPDRDAGSRAIVQTMRQLQAMDFVVKFWTANQYYDPIYRGVLEDAGIEIVAGERWDNRFERYIRYAGAEFDLVLLSRPEVAAIYLDALRAHTRAPLMLYGHDLHFVRMGLRANVTDDAAEQRDADSMRSLETGLWQTLDGAIYPSETEASVVADHVPARKAHVVPLYHFDEAEYGTVRPPASRTTLDAVRLLFVAGFGHSPNVDAAQWLVRDIFPRVLRELPNATLDLVGSNPTTDVLALAQTGGVHVTGSVPQDVLDDYYRRADVAIVPLRFGAGVKLKVLEAMVKGLPVVTTSIGAQGLPGVEDCIRVEDSSDALAAAIVQIAIGLPASHDRVVAAQDYVRARYSDTAMRSALWRVFADGARTRSVPQNARGQSA
ncbi:MAG: glycosyltransferase [Luteimonas sp.]